MFSFAFPCTECIINFWGYKIPLLIRFLYTSESLMRVKCFKQKKKVIASLYTIPLTYQRQVVVHEGGLQKKCKCSEKMSLMFHFIITELSYSTSPPVIEAATTRFRGHHCMFVFYVCLFYACNLSHMEDVVYICGMQ